MPNLDPFQNTDGIPVGQDAENLALTVARSGALRSGAGRSGFVGSPGDVVDVHEIGAAGSVDGAGYGWRDRHLPEPTIVDPENQAPTVTIPAPQTANAFAVELSVANGNAVTVTDPDDNGGVEQLDIVASGGVLELSGNAGNVTVLISTNTHKRFTGALVDINNAIDGMQLIPSVNGDYTITFTADDLGNTGAGGALTDQKILVVTAINFGS